VKVFIHTFEQPEYRFTLLAYLKGKGSSASFLFLATRFLNPLLVYSAFY